MAANEFQNGGARDTGVPVRASRPYGETHWRCGLVDGVTTGSSSCLVDTEHRAELRLANGRLIRGPGYAAAPRPTRQLLARVGRSEEHTSELQSRPHLVCRLLLE